MKAAVHSEHTEQMQFVSWFRRTFPGVRIFAIPNGGARSKVVAMQMQNEGVLKGVPDLYVPAWKLWVEMKRKKGGQLSPAQKDMIEYLTLLGDTVIVGHGFIDAVEKVRAMRSQAENP